ncbi:MAG: ATP-binding protein, partial [Hyalangium sp.]|uniref:ATP-binding protein n=1 Tax=Hyalangium sp. TaxID=2028555 RepID=UPI00389AA2DB
MLIEREHELATIEHALRCARDGVGNVVVIEGPVGKGKSRLLNAAGDLGRQCGFHVLGAQATALEQEFPFGVAIQLFEPKWISSSTDTRERLLAGPAKAARRLLEGLIGEQLPPRDNAYPIIHGLFWLVSNLVHPPQPASPTTPVAMLVDDIHWADAPSLRFLAYLAERVSDLPIVLVVASRSGEPTSDPGVLRVLRGAAMGRTLKPRALSPAGVEALVQEEFPDADPDFCAACARVTSGNPFLVIELLAQVKCDGYAPDDATAKLLANLAPSSVLNAVIARLGAMPEPVRQLACAVAILGDGAWLHHAAELAGLEIRAASDAADILAASHMLRDGVPLSFVHTVIGSSVVQSMSKLAREEAHRRAAAILDGGGALPEAVAAHILATSPRSSAGAVEVLRAAARNAVASGAPATAVRLLQRALAEPPPDQACPEVLAELGQAEALTGSARAVDRLGQARAASEDPTRRAELALTQGRALYVQGRHGEAAAVFDLGHDEVKHTGAALADELEAAYVSAASLVPELLAEARRRREEMLEQAEGEPTTGQQVALAHAAAMDALKGEPREAVARLGKLAWKDGALLRAETADGLAWPLLARAFTVVDELEQAVALCDAAMADARRHDSPFAFATASACRARPRYDQARIVEAAADAQAALDARRDGWRTFVGLASAVCAQCCIQAGRLDEAERILAITNEPEVQDSLDHAQLLDARAQLRLAQMRPDEALVDAIHAGKRLEDEFCVWSPGVVAWRTTAALAHLAL